MAIGRTNCGAGGSIGGLPQFTYTGDYTLLDDGDKNWRIKLLTSGTLTFEKSPGTIDVFCVGGGGGGNGYSNEHNGGGGGGGYTVTQINVSVVAGQSIDVAIGAGGNKSTNGGATSFGGITAEGGKTYSNKVYTGGDGGSGGGAGNSSSGAPGKGGTDGAGGAGTKEGAGGKGQGTTTAEFGESGATIYSPGGEGGSGSTTTARTPPAANTGGGGYGVGYGYSSQNASGASGIVVIRNHREAAAL